MDYNNFKNEIEQSIAKYDADHIDIGYTSTKIYGFYHSNNNSFPVTNEYPINIASIETLTALCNELNIGYCEDDDE